LTERPRCNILRRMFDSLANALGKAYRAMVGQKVLTEANVDEGIRAVRTALLEADVNFQVGRSSRRSSRASSSSSASTTR